MPISLAFRQSNTAFDVGEVMVHRLLSLAKIPSLECRDDYAVGVSSAVVLLFFIEHHNERQAGNDLGQHDVELSREHGFRLFLAVG